MEREKKKYEEPTKEEEAGGYHRFRVPLGPYERYMKEEEIPIFRGIGAYDVRQLSLAPWKRLGGRGIFLQLDGLAAIRGMYVVEVPAAGALNAERHLYDEFMYIVEGRGSTEIWREGSAKRQTFEWQAGSMFSIPINTHHRLVNASTDLSTRPQLPFRPERLFVQSDIAGNFEIVDVIIGNRSQFAQATPMSARIAAETSFGFDLHMDTAMVAMDVVLRIANITGAPSDFRATIAGTSAIP